MPNVMDEIKTFLNETLKDNERVDFHDHDWSGYIVSFHSLSKHQLYEQSYYMAYCTQKYLTIDEVINVVKRYLEDFRENVVGD